MDLLIGIMTFIVGVLIIVLQINKYIKGYNYKDDNEFGQSAFIQFIGLGVIIIMIGLFLIF